MRLPLCLAAILCGASVLLADTVHLSGRGVVKGQIVREDEAKVVVRLPTGGELEIDREDIERIERGALPAEEFARRLAALRPDDAQGHYELALWAKEQREVGLCRKALERALAIDPDHIEARTALGYERTARGWKQAKPAAPPRDEPAPRRKPLVKASDPAAKPPVDRSLKLRQRVLARWEDARDQALALIFDLSRYPDENHGASGQAEVDAAVACVRVALGPLAELEQPDLTALRKLEQRDAQAARDILARGGPWGTRLLARLELERVCLLNARARAATEPERRQVEITNDYRYLMGRVPLELDARLTAAARGHSREMAALKYFDHFSPTAALKTPGDRARAEGYEGPVGENIYLGKGDPQAAHDGWIHSSGHHRNLLDASYRCMGVGQHQDHWTQNFGAGPAGAR